MGFNYGRERKKFEMDFAKKRLEYAKAGMSESAINEIYEFDLGVFNGNRAYAIWNQSPTTECFDGDSDMPDKITFVNRVVSYEQDFILLSRYGWLDEVSDPVMHKKITQLSARDKETVTLRMDGFSQAEIAEKIGVSQWAVSKRLTKIKNILGNF